MGSIENTCEKSEKRFQDRDRHTGVPLMTLGVGGGIAGWVGRGRNTHHQLTWGPVAPPCESAASEV